MYNAEFISDKGDVFVFGKKGGNVFDIEGLSGISVNVGTSQGFSQIGESVDTLSVEGKTLTINGVFFGDIQAGKRRISKVLAPFVSGKLIFEGSHYMYVFVKDAPTFSPLKNRGAFSLRLFAPYPFFKMRSEGTFFIGAITPAFSFPVNYEQPHIFGIKSPARYINVLNHGDVKVPFRVDFTTETKSSNITLTNMRTLQFLRLNGILNFGERLTVYRTENGVLRAELTSRAQVTDVLSWIDEESNLFELSVGDNLISADDDEGGTDLTAQITFHAAVGGVYET